MACSNALGLLTVPFTTDLTSTVAWNTFEMTFNMGLTLPTTYGGTSTPTFTSWVEKDSRKVLTAAVDATAATAAVALPAANDTHVSV